MTGTRTSIRCDGGNDVMLQNFGRKLCALQPGTAGSVIFFTNYFSEQTFLRKVSPVDPGGVWMVLGFGLSMF